MFLLMAVDSQTGRLDRRLGLERHRFTVLLLGSDLTWVEVPV
jgi:hypothetical protein